MSEITNPPTVPEISTPVPQRTDPENFSVLMDRFLREMPVTVDGINLTVSWTYDTVQVVKEFSQAAAKSVDDAAQQVELAKQEVKLAKSEAVNAAGSAQDSADSAAASEQAREDITHLLDTLTGELGLPENGTVGAPIIKTPEGLAFDEYPLGSQARSNETPIVEVSSDHWVLPYQKVGIDTRSGSFELILPNAPEVGVWVSIYDINDRLKDWNSVTLRGNGQKIMGLEEDLNVNLRNCRFTLEFLGEEKGWVITK